MVVNRLTDLGRPTRRDRLVSQLKSTTDKKYVHSCYCIIKQNAYSLAADVVKVGNWYKAVQVGSV